jgi:hypothetical protein
MSVTPALDLMLLIVESGNALNRPGFAGGYFA